MADLFSVFPFGNTVELIRIKGRVLRAALEQSVSVYQLDDPKGNFLQMAGKFDFIWFDLIYRLN